jgi:octaprenyl-diphosphate synthase
LPRTKDRPRLEKFHKVLASELREFDREYRDTLRSNVFLVDQVIGYLVQRKGKRIRPILTFLAARLFGDVSPGCVKAAIVVELLHVATLIHDDVVDEAPIRRGFPSLNDIWRNKVSVLVGDYILAKSLTGMLDLRDLEVFDVLSTTAKRMSRGELLQIAKARKLDITEEVYMDMIADKTASLLSACCELGAITSDRGAEDRAILRTFGEKLGIAFQIRDDILDFVGTERLIGKQIGRDMREQKITLPLIHAFQHGEPSESKRVMRKIKKGLSRHDIRGIVDFVKRNGGIEYAAELAHSYAEDAKQLLSQFPPSGSLDRLAEFSDYLTARLN